MSPDRGHREGEIRYAVGAMTGTSLDAIDASLIRATGRGIAMRIEHLSTLSHSLGEVGASLRRIADQHATTAREIAAANDGLSRLYAAAIREAAANSPQPPSLACVHGQTVYHAPPLTWQLINAPLIASETQLPIVFDLRQADVARGGEGAPITPIADWIMYRDESPRSIINLGGFCNITNLPGSAATIDAITAQDVCVCNQLLDWIARQYLAAPFDRDGAAAATGTSHAVAEDTIAQLLAAQTAARRSLGTGDELRDRIRALANEHRLVGPDLAATACVAIGRVIAGTIPAGSGLAVLAGGGVHNAALVAAIRRGVRCPVVDSDEVGIPAAAREAAAFAVLGLLCADRVPITLPAVTGVPAPAPVSGAWVYP